jgi:hypothetical protein
MSDSLHQERLSALLRQHGSVPPPWAYAPRTHPYDIGWRMGGGEGHIVLFNEWASSRSWSFEERVAYIRRWDPPHSWLEWVAWFLWPEAYDDTSLDVSDAHFRQIKALGFGSKAQWRRAFNTDPDGYPCSSDTSSSWCSPLVRVSHPRFGAGTVTRESGDNIEVRFDDGPRRVLRRGFLTWLDGNTSP